MTKPKIRIVLPKVASGSPDEATISRAQHAIASALRTTGLIHHMYAELSGPGSPRGMKSLVSPNNGLSPKGDKGMLFSGEAVELTYSEKEKFLFTPELRMGEIFFGRLADGRLAVIEHVCGVLRFYIEEEEDRLAWVGKMTAPERWGLMDHADDADEVRRRCGERTSV